MNNDQIPSQNPQPEAPQPVAYDAQGRPLYAHPPAAPAPTPAPTAEPVAPTAESQQPTLVHVVRSVTPEKPHVTPEAQQRHEHSKRLFPFLNLSEGEYVISAVRRHPIGLIMPLGIGTLLIALTFALLFNYSEFATALAIEGPIAEVGTVAIPMLLFVGLIAFGMFVSYYVFTSNRFFLTNESVIQEIQHTLFSRHEQTASLGSIEDASFTQHGILQQVFNYGDIRLSTEGDETTYRFTYVANPRQHIATLNNAVEAFKNGRPVGD